MTLFARIEAIEPAIVALQADVAALKASPPSGVTAEQLAAIDAKVDALRADVGTPAGA